MVRKNGNMNARKFLVIGVSACVTLATASSAAVRADFIHGRVSAFAGMEERDPSQESRTAEGLTPSVSADFELFEEGFYLHSQAAASITAGEGVSIHISAQTLVDGDFDVTGAWAEASASWRERLFFSLLDNDEEDLAQLVLQGTAFLDIDGHISTGGTGVGVLSIGASNNGDIVFSTETTSSINTVVPIEFNLGLVPVSAGLYTGTVNLFVHALSRSIFIPDTSVVDFSNTVTFKNVVITDLEGNPIPGSLTSESGVNYNPVVQAVPEPGSLTLAGLGALGMAVGAWRRRRTAA